MKKLWFSLICFNLSTLGFSDGKDLYTKNNCHTCHGAEGKAPIAPNYPKIAGQNAAYTEAQIKDIKSGKRSNGMSAAMKAMVTNLNDADISAISKYLESVK